MTILSKQVTVTSKYTNRLQNLSMKSSYEKDLKSVNTRSNLYICILILNELQAHKRFKLYMEIKVINLMPYLFSNNVILS